MTENLAKLEKLFKRKGNIKMLLMLATKDDCKKMVEIISGGNRETEEALLEYVSTLNWNSAGDDTVNTVAEVLYNSVKELEIPKDSVQKEKLLEINGVIKNNITESTKTMLADLSSDTNIPDGLSVDEADTILLWSLIQNVLAELPACSISIKASTGYRGKKKDKPDPVKMLKKIALDKVKVEKLTKKDKATLDNFSEMVESMCDRISKTISDYKVPLTDADKEQSAITTFNTIMRIGKVENMIPLIRSFIDTTIDASRYELRKWLTTQSIYLALGDHIKDKSQGEKRVATLEFIKLPGVATVLFEKEPTYLDLRLAINSIATSTPPVSVMQTISTQKKAKKAM